ncbi:unnamed protein product [Hymenolepis diminuta]|uniref:Lipoprotein n=1 Tax=Hymenolepis diminuta TaxID=6216 RepID=A0A0R3SWJ1_HYMDI|nr:unnamed protein product [Hymenolepis diminuta]VUZ43075.1 unnamed protein product [Hymenolepis diminuta]
MKNSSTPFFLSLFSLLALIAICGSAVPAAPLKPGSPEAKKAYEAKLAICKDSSKAERCKWLARSLVYYDCMDAEDSCAYEAGKNGCMKETLGCIKNVVGAP